MISLFHFSEALEARRMLSTAIRSYDGTGNNLAHPEWGSINVDLLREAAAAYADGIAAPAGASRPSARTISNLIGVAEPDGTRNSSDLSAWMYVWGQFIDHDLDLTGAQSPAEAFNVSVPQWDPQFDPTGTGAKLINLNRSQYDSDTGKTTARQQVNTITAYLDGSVVYGSDPTRAAALRTFVGGQMKTSAGNLLPYNTMGLANANDAHLRADSSLFVAGDVRANENIDLIALQTLFVREHNRLATQIARSNSRLGDEQIYQRARALVVGEIESITYNEFLPALLGTNAIGSYHGYRSGVNSGISTEFSTAAYRFGHSLLGADIEFMDNDGEDVHDEVELRDAFFNPTMVEQLGIDPILKYLASDAAQELDTKVVDDVRNFLFGPPGAGGFDLASLNIQRGRDHGLADYNTTRVAMGLQRVTSFNQITSDPVLAAQLKQLYGTVNNVDLWVGGLAEDHARGSAIGATFKAIIADQFSRIRDGDRFWFERTLAGTSELRTLENTSLADIIKRNSGTTNLQSNVFLFDVNIGGRLFADFNNNGRQDRNEAALRGWQVQLLDEAGAVVAATMSGFSGRYNFDDLDLGTYKVNVVAPAGWVATRAAGELKITRGMIVQGQDYGFRRAGSSAPASATMPTDRIRDVTDGVIDEAVV